MLFDQQILVIILVVAGVLDFEFVERGRNIVSCSRDGTIRLWDVSEQHVIHSYGSDTGHGIVNACTLRQTEAFDLQEVNGCSGIFLLGNISALCIS